MFVFHVHTLAGIIVTMIQIFMVYSLVNYQTAEVTLLKPALGFTLQPQVSLFVQFLVLFKSFITDIGAPSVYRITYSERHHVSSDGVLGSVNCLSQNSPPTTVTWTRDGSTINEVDGQDYEMMQIVLERQSYSRFQNTLLIKNAVHLAGTHRYCCRVSNSAGTSSSQCVATSWTG